MSFTSFVMTMKRAVADLERRVIGTMIAQTVCEADVLCVDVADDTIDFLSVFKISLRAHVLDGAYEC